MKFISLKLRNWRSYLGDQPTIEFAAHPQRNITILVGQNGAGKTALLNAFTWVLFGETTAGFRRPEDLFNHAALASLEEGQSDDMQVDLVFEHEGARYAVHRRLVAFRRDGETLVENSPLFSATRTRTTTDQVSEAEVQAILPAGLHPFFFFPAENIGKDFDQNDAAQIRASMRTAIDVLLGIERYEHALNVVSMALKKHLPTPRGGSDRAIAEAEASMNEARQKWEEASQRRKELPGLISKAQALVDSTEQSLEGIQEVQELFERRSKLQANLELAQFDAKRAREEQRKVANHRCVVLFGHELFSTALGVLNEAHRKGEIPPKISAGLLTELVDERDTCICGRPLDASHKEHLDRLRASTVTDLVAQEASNLRGRLPSLLEIDGRRADEVAAEELLEQVKAATEAESRIAQCRNELRELMEDRELPDSDPAELRRAWQAAERKCASLRMELDELDKTLPALALAKDEAERKHQNLLKKSAKTATIGQAREYLSNVEKTLEAIQAIIRRSARRDVERAMNHFYRPLLLKDYGIELTEDFRYQVVDAAGRAVGASSSEVALATFAFVGALASLMPRYANLDSLLPRGDSNSPGSIELDAEHAYPVVLDAPYSPFGEEYSRHFSEALPSLLPQSVVIVREDQLRFVEPMLKEGRVGAAYLLRMHSGQRGARTIEWCGSQFDYVVNTGHHEEAHTELASLPVL